MPAQLTVIGPTTRSCLDSDLGDASHGAKKPRQAGTENSVSEQMSYPEQQTRASLLPRDLPPLRTDDAEEDRQIAAICAKWGYRYEP